MTRGSNYAALTKAVEDISARIFRDLNGAFRRVKA